MEKYDLVVFNQQAHICGRSSVCQRSDNGSDGFGPRAELAGSPERGNIHTGSGIKCN